MSDIQDPATEQSSRRQAASYNAYIEKFLNVVVCSEWCLIEFMVGKKKWPQPSASPPADYKYYGAIDNGVTLYLLNHTQLITDPDGKVLVGKLLPYMKQNGIALPASNISDAQYQQIEQQNEVAPDGSILGMGPYSAYDQGWIGALYNLLLSMEVQVKAPFQIPASSPAQQMTNSVGTSFTIGLVSDWGTDTDAAKAVMAKLLTKNPYSIIHLGDVYYSGSPTDQPNGLPFFGYGFSPLGEEANFISSWPQQQNVTSFTMNSNHEMYTGGYGLFADALTSTSPFVLQGGCGVFSIQVADWTILALDSAYNADPEQLYMYGQLDAAGSTTQADWIKGLGLDHTKTIVLTHHNALPFACNPQAQSYYQGFWDEVTTALGGDPHAWYWGHVHYGVAYMRPVIINSTPKFITKTFCRCIGHGALPFGKTTELQLYENNIEWFATEGPDWDIKLYNGFATLTFDLDGDVNEVTTITENFYDVGSDVARFTKQIFGSSGS